MGRKIKINITALLRAGFLAVLSIGLLCSALSIPAAAAYFPFNTNVNMNIGIGTSTPQGAFVVTNGNVGIGTWAPAAPLTVGANAFTVNNAGTITAVTGITTSGGYTQSGNGINAFTGNVGVGIAVPGQKLQVQGTIQALGEIVLGNVAINGNVGIGTFNPFGGGLIVVPAVTGNVGIGSLAPGTALDVNGTARVTGFTLSGNGAASGNVLVGNGVGVGTWMPASTLAGAGSGSNYWLLNGGAGNVGINTSYAVGIGTSFVGGTGEAALSVMNGNVGIGTWLPLGALDINTGNNVLVESGNVGIGTTNVSLGHVTVSGTGAQTIAVNTTDAGIVSSATFVGYSAPSELQITSWGSGAIATFFGQTMASWTSLIDLNNTGTTNGLVIGTRPAAPFLFGTNNLERMRIDSSGNVGVGTTLPSSGLSVGLNGESIGINYTNGTSAPSNGLIVQGNVGLGSLAPGQALDVNGTARVTGFTLSGNGAASGNVLVGNGVGVGTWMPASTLAGAGSGSNYWLLNGGAGNVGINTSYAVGIGTSFVGGTGEAALSVMNGNVGIGTWVPRAQLDVEGTLSIASFAGNLGIGTLNPITNLDVYKKNDGGGFDQIIARFSVDANGTEGAGIAINNTDGADKQNIINFESQGQLLWQIGNDFFENGNQNFFIQNNISGFVPFWIDPNGNVGIGTSVPSGTLDVEGGAAPANTAGSSITFAAQDATGPANNAGGSINFFGGGGAGTFGPGSINFSNITAMSESRNANDGYSPYGGPVGLSFTISNSFAANNNDSILNFTAVNSNPNNQAAYIGAVSAPGAGNFAPYLIFGQTIASNSYYERMRLDSSGNLGIGTTLPQGGLVVMNGNAGIGTWVPAVMLDVKGTVRMTGLTLTGNGAASGNVLVGNAVGVGTWMPASTLAGAGSGSNYWLLNGGAGNVGINTSYAVGIGTSFVGGTGEAALSIMNGNVGIGTWVPSSSLHVFKGSSGQTPQAFSNLTVESNTSNYIQLLSTNASDQALYFGDPNEQVEGGMVYNGTAGPRSLELRTENTSRLAVSGIGNVGIGTILSVGGLAVMNGNVGIGTWVPALMLDVNGTARMTGFTLTGNGAASGNVLVGNGVGVGTWMPASTLATSAGSNYWLNDTGNVGINTTYNIGLGTISAVNALNILGNIGIGTFSYDQYMKTAAPSGGMIISGNVGIGTWAPMAALQLGEWFSPVVGTPLQLYLASYSATTGYPQLVGNWNNGLSWGIGQATASTTDNALLLGIVNTPGSPPLLWNNSTGLNVLVSGNIGIGTINTTGMNTNLYVPTNVGIGTKAPSDTLDVVGNPSSGDIAVFENTNVSSESDIGFRDNTGLAKLWIGYGNASEVAPYTGISFMEFDSPAFEITNNNGVGLSEYFTSAGNIGIGTFVTNGKMVVTGGNVGIGSTAPGTLLDVNGTARIQGFTLTGNGAANGNVLVGNSVGVGTWMPASTLAGAGSGSNYWLLNGGVGNVGINTSYAVGIGTSFVGGTGEAAFAVMKGNVGIGTWLPGAALDFPSGTSLKNGIGFGAGAGTTLNLFQNSSNSLQFNVNGGINFDDSFGRGITILPGHLSQITHYGDDASTASQFFQFSTDSNITGLSSASGELIQTASVFSPASGAFNYSGIYINDTINQTGTSTGITRGLFVNPVLTSTRDFRAIETSIGNVGIGTISGNLGIGSQWPGQRLDVNGTARMTGFTLSGNGAASGNVLVGNGVGVGTWMPASTLAGVGSGSNYWLLNGGVGNVGINTSYAVGIGTSFVGGTGEAAFSVMNGNVGIGTWVPHVQLDVEGTLSTAYFAGNVGIGTWLPAFNLDVYAKGQAFGIMEVGDQNGTYFQVSGASGMLGIRADFIGSLASLTTGIINGANSGSAGTEFFHESGTDSYASGTGQLVQLWADPLDGQFNPSSGNGVYDMLEVDPNINQTGTATGITRAIFIKPNNPSAYDFRALEISTGNVGIGTISGNLGIGSQWPGQRLDVNGTARMTGFTLTGNGAAAGNVMVSNTIGVGTWMPTTTLPVGTLIAGTVNQVAYYSAPTTIASNSAMVFNAPNVGLGTVAPLATLQVVGNIGIGTVANGDKFITTSPPNGGMIVEGNVGIGSTAPGQNLDMQGTLRALGEIINGNVGIGTYKENAGLSVMNGNVGIGTWNPRATLDVEGPLSTVSFAGNVGIGTLVAANQLTVFGNAYALGSLLASPNGSTTAAPRLFGFSPAFTAGQAAQVQFGDVSNTLQNGYGDRMQLSAYWGIELRGNAETTAPAFATGLAADASLTIFAPSGTANILNLVNNAGTTTYDVVNTTGNVGIGTTIPSTALTVMSGNVGIGTWVPNNKLEVKGGNVGIGTYLGGAMVTLGGSCAAHQGTGVCFGASSTGVTCLGYCTAGAWPNCTTCTCC